MKPAFQQIIDKGKGDCFSACLASLLELPIEDVPKFRKLENEVKRPMMSLAREWLSLFGLGLVTIQMEDWDDPETTGKDMRIISATPGVPCIAGGTSPNLEGVDHAVVGEIDDHGLNFVMTHDPNPSGKGIVGPPKHLYFLIPLQLAVEQ